MNGLVRPASNEAGLAFSGVAILGAMLVFAPLIKGGNRPLPLLVLELTAIVLLFLLLLRPGFGQQLSRPLLVALGALIALPLVQLLPLPEFLWNWLPGRALYADALTAVGSAAQLPNPLADPRRHRVRPVRPPGAAGGFSGHRFHQPNAAQATDQPVHRPRGTPGHHRPRPVRHRLADRILATCRRKGSAAPTALTRTTIISPASWKWRSRSSWHCSSPTSISAATGHPGRQRRQNLRQRIAQLFASGIRFNAVAIYTGAALAILLGLIFSRSRTAIALVMLGIFCAPSSSAPGWAGNAPPASSPY